jgi:hypothetical protein
VTFYEDDIWPSIQKIVSRHLHQFEFGHSRIGRRNSDLVLNFLLHLQFFNLNKHKHDDSREMSKKVPNVCQATLGNAPKNFWKPFAQHSNYNGDFFQQFSKRSGDSFEISQQSGDVLRVFITVYPDVAVCT